VKQRLWLLVAWVVLAATVWVRPTPQVSLAAVKSAAADSFSFGVAGDYDGNENAAENLTHIGQAGLAFQVALGDLSYGFFPTEAQWCNFVKERVGADFPFQLVSGDHEDNGPEGDIREFAKCLPDRMGSVGEYGEQYYFDYPRSNPLIRVILLSPTLQFADEPSGTNYKEGSPRYEWTEAAIDDARAKGIPWVAAGTHKQCLSIARLAGCEVGPDLLNMLVEKRVDLLFMAHDHSYQRGKQLTHGAGCDRIPVSSFNGHCVGGTADPNGRYTKGKGTIPMVLGTGGDALFAVDPSGPTGGYWASWMGNNTAHSHGFGKFDVTRNQLSFNFVGTSDGTYTDSFTITQEPGLSAGPAAVDFGAQPVGSAAAPRPVTVTNTGPAPIAIGAATVEAARPGDFPMTANTCTGATLSAGGSCSISAGFAPSATGPMAGTVVFQNDSSSGPLRIRIAGTATPAGAGGATPPPGGSAATSGYWMTSAEGAIYSFGNAAPHGSTADTKLARPIVTMASTPTGNGYWLVASDGGIFSFGDARFYGSTGSIALAKPIVGMAPTPSGLGYWLVASDGGIFAFGDATFYGSTGAIKLAKPIVTMGSTPSGRGYWLAASDGGIFAFGDARFYGSTGAIRIVQPIVGMASARSGAGYWLVAADGGIFAFGDARFQGSTGAIKLAKPIIGMVSSRSGEGYLLVASDGGIFAFGDAAFQGSAGSLGLTKPVVSAAAHP
jgi:ASPM-SPD-2-Hydin domain-containing protein/calcineurin-like phosphoesterase family protein